MTFQLEQMVQRPTWKQALLELIITEKLDPWNIDIAKITNGFIEKIKEMKTLELFIPANMILASAILLRYKSDVLRFQEEHVEQEMVAEEGIETGEKPQIKELKLLSRIPPKRPITLPELMEELDRVLKYEEKRGKIEKRKVEAILNLKIEARDIEKQMQDVYDMILKQMNGGEHVLFSDLISEKEKKDVVYTLLSLLHLSQDNKINIKQKKLFGEIFISPEKNKN